ISIGEYALKGLRDFGITKLTDAFVCPDAVAVRAIRSHATDFENKDLRNTDLPNCDFVNHPARGKFLIASPPRRLEAPDSPYHLPASRPAIEWCASHRRHSHQSA